MKKSLSFLILLFLCTCCTEEPLTFTHRIFEKKLALPNNKDFTTVKVDIPVANNTTITADSINNKVFSVVKEIVYLGDKPFISNDYNLLLVSFIDSYRQFIRDFPDYHIPWEASVEGKVIYQSESVLNIEINYYSFTGGAHGNGGFRSVLIDPETGKTIANKALFKDENGFKAFAEKQFRLKYKIPEKDPINSTGLQFEEEKFCLPQNIFYTKKGLLLYYNQYEIASYVDGTKEVLLPYAEVDSFLAVK